MAKNISLMGASYSDVPAVTLPQTGGGTARFDDASVTTATAADVAQGKVFLAADGTITTGTASGSGSIVVVDTPDGHGGTIREITATNVTTLVEKTITENGTYNPSDDDADGYSSVTVNVDSGFTADEIAEYGISGDIGGNAVSIRNYAFNSCPQITGASFPNVTSIGSYAFATCHSLASLYFPNVNNVGQGAFLDCSSLTEVDFPMAERLQSSAFESCSALSYVSLPNAKYIERSAFLNCINLQTIDLPQVTYIYAYAFVGCNSLSIVSGGGSDLYIADNAFTSCSNLRTVNIPSASYIGGDAFNCCYNLHDITLANVGLIGASAFASCNGLTSVTFPKASIINGSAFAHCENLSAASFGSFISMRGSYHFYKCYRLLSLYLMGSSVVKFPYANTFTSTPIGGFTDYTDGVVGSIYVPASLYTSYTTSYGWSNYSSRFVSV